MGRVRKYSYSDEQVLQEGRELITPGASTYSVATKLGRPQSTVWWHITHRLEDLDAELYHNVIRVLHTNSRGGRH